MPIPTPTWSKFRRAIDDPRLLRIGLLRVARDVNASINHLRLDPANSVMDEDWDTLILLDACRYDSFITQKHILSTDGELKPRISPASSSLEFMRANYQSKSHHDTVYVSANPYIERLDEGTFHAVERLYAGESWDDELNTVPPETVAEASSRARERYPQKRLIIHFMQPHYPFIGNIGRKIHHRGYNPNGRNSDEQSIWKQLQRDPRSLELNDVISAYHENLVIVLNAVDDLVSQLDGTTIISADHGNLLGERLWPFPVSDFGHPTNAYNPALVTVPWYRIDSGNRPVISSEPPDLQRKHANESVIQDRLKNLGYRE